MIFCAGYFPLGSLIFLGVNIGYTALPQIQGGIERMSHLLSLDYKDNSSAKACFGPFCVETYCINQYFREAPDF